MHFCEEEETGESAESRYEYKECGGIPLCIEPSFAVCHMYTEYKRRSRELLGLSQNADNRSTEINPTFLFRSVVIDNDIDNKQCMQETHLCYFSGYEQLEVYIMKLKLLT